PLAQVLDSNRRPVCEESSLDREPRAQKEVVPCSFDAARTRREELEEAELADSERSLVDEVSTDPLVDELDLLIGYILGFQHRGGDGLDAFAAADLGDLPVDPASDATAVDGDACPSGCRRC